MEINVVGEHSVEVAPEFARVQLSAQFEGADRVLVTHRASDLANRLSSALGEQRSASAIVVEPIQVSSWRPNESERLWHGATVGLSAEFSEVEDLAEFQAAWVGVEGVQFGWVDWRLTPESEQAREVEVIAGAFASATRRAHHIADVAGHGPLSVEQVSEPGMSSERAYTMATKLGSDVAVDIRPAPVRVTARLEVRFRAE